MTVRLHAALPASILTAACLLSPSALAQDGHADHAAKSVTSEENTCPADCAKACCANLETMIPGFKAPKLWIGAEAPKLQIAQFIKGDSVEAFEEGRTYVVEFWATWCGPCVKAFPHLSEMQEKMHEKVTFIGVNVWDTKPDESQGARIERVSTFVEGQGDKMSYTVAIETDDKMSKTWLKPAAQNGIPAAFIVDGEGKIAWIGHPSQMDEPLEQIVAGEYDRESASKEILSGMIVQAGWQAYVKGIMSSDEGEAEKGYSIGRALAAQHFADNAQGLNALAWPVLSSDRITHRDLGFAKDLAQQAAELTEWNNPDVLDTYALALYKTGDIEGAIETQTKALDLTPEDAESRVEMIERLEMFKSDG